MILTLTFFRDLAALTALMLVIVLGGALVMP
jgi:hypothetical protein